MTDRADDLINAWWGKGSALDVAMRLNIRPWRRVYRGWCQLRAQGLLPPFQRPRKGFDSKARALYDRRAA